MESNTSVYIVIVLLVGISTKIIAQEAGTTSDSVPQISGPLVTLTLDSFIDTTLVLLQSLYHDTVHKFELTPKTETVTILGVDLNMHYEGYLTLSDATVKKGNTFTDGTVVHFVMDVPTIVVNKTYSVSSAQNPSSTSDGYIILNAQGVTLYVVLSITEIPYFVSTVTVMSRGNTNTTIYGEGTLLATEIQRSLGNLMMTQFQATDVSGFFGDVRSKLTDIFDKNSLILCMSCEYSYCQCFD